jgi:hypothetical protein
MRAPHGPALHKNARVIRSSAALHPCIFPTPALDCGFLFFVFFSFEEYVFLVPDSDKLAKDLTRINLKHGLGTSPSRRWKGKVPGRKNLHHLRSDQDK